jgi:hypothetical protein
MPGYMNEAPPHSLPSNHFSTTYLLSSSLNNAPLIVAETFLACHCMLSYLLTIARGANS